MTEEGWNFHSSYGSSAPNKFKNIEQSIQGFLLGKGLSERNTADIQGDDFSSSWSEN